MGEANRKKQSESELKEEFLGLVIIGSIVFGAIMFYAILYPIMGWLSVPVGFGTSFMICVIIFSQIFKYFNIGDIRE